MARPRTNRDQEILALVGANPAISVREIQSHFGYASPASVHRYLLRLRAAGLIEWNPGRWRSMKVIDGLTRQEVAQLRS